MSVETKHRTRKFWKRYNKVLLDKVALEQGRDHLREENRKLQALLKQYLDAISVNQDVLSTPANPLMLVGVIFSSPVFSSSSSILVFIFIYYALNSLQKEKEYSWTGEDVNSLVDEKVHRTCTFDESHLFICFSPCTCVLCRECSRFRWIRTYMVLTETPYQGFPDRL